MSLDYVDFNDEGASASNDKGDIQSTLEMKRKIEDLLYEKELQKLNNSMDWDY